MNVREQIDPHLLRAAASSVVESGKGAHALLETVGPGAPRHRLIPVTEWDSFKDSPAGAAWRLVAGITSDGHVTELGESAVRRSPFREPNGSPA